MRYIVTHRPEYFIRRNLHHDFLTIEESLEMIGDEGMRAFDLETTALSQKLGVRWCAQFGISPTKENPDGHQIIADCEIPYIPGAWEKVDLLRYKECLENEQILWIGQNLVFDMAWVLMEHGIRIINVFDTFIVDKVLTAGRKWERPTYKPLYELPADFARRKKKEKERELRKRSRKEYVDSLEQLVLSGEITQAEADMSFEDEGFDLENDEIAVEKMRPFLHNLAAVQKRWLGRTSLDKDVRKQVMVQGINTPETLDYSFRDVDKDMFKLAEVLWAASHQLGMTVAVSEENAFVCVSAWMEANGFYLSKEKWMAKVGEDIAAREKARETLLEAVRTGYPDLYANVFDVNWSSPAQVIQVFQSMGIDVSDPKKPGSNTVSAKVLKHKVKDHPILGVYLSFKEAEKQVSTYGPSWAREVVHPHSNREDTEGFLFDGRVHTKTKQLGAATGRISSGSTKAKDSKGKQVNLPFPNIANLPREARTRQCFTAPNKNRRIVTTDYGGQESVIFADWTQEPQLLAFYEKDGSDMHSFIAKMLFPDVIPADMPLGEVKANFPEERQNAKDTGFAIQYGGNGRTIADNANIPEKDGTALYNKYMTTFKGAKTHFDKVQQEALKVGYILTNPRTGRRRWLDGWEEWKKREAEKEKLIKIIGWPLYKEHKAANSDYYQEVLKPLVSTNFRVMLAFGRQALNTPCQGRGSEMSKRAARMFYDRVRKSKARLKGGVMLVNFVYDELVAEVSKGNVAWTKKNMQECMEEASSLDLQTIPFIPAEPCDKEYWDH